MTTRCGYFLSSEEYPPQELVRQARLAEEAGFEALWISDHFHPWLDEQGQSGHVWSVIGALSQATSLPITTMRRLWPTDEIPGEALQLLPLPRRVGQLAELVTEDMISAPCGPDPAVHLAGIQAYRDAGFDEVYIGQAGPDAEGFFEFYGSQVLPRLRQG